MNYIGSPRIYLKPGQLFFGSHPAVVTTVLGSCVAVVMFHSRLGLAAICHAVMPRCDAKLTCSTECADRRRYINCVIPEMIGKMCAPGANRREITVKLFGGSDMFSMSSRPGHESIGRQNIIAAELALKSESLPVKTSVVGGRHGRKIIFYTATGEVLMRPLQRNAKMVLK